MAIYGGTHSILTSFTAVELAIPSPLKQGSTGAPSVSTRFVRETPDSNDQTTMTTVEREFEGFLFPHESPGDADDLERKPIRYMRYFRILRLTNPEKFELAEKENYVSLMNLEDGREPGPLYVFGFARIRSDDDSESETERTAVNEEVPLLSSVIMRTWWSRDPSNRNRECFLCLLFLKSILNVVVASGWRPSTRTTSWRTPIQTTRSATASLILGSRPRTGSSTSLGQRPTPPSTIP
jgi:hypothetical protein